VRSRHPDLFNHDRDAPGYDRDVRNEAHPIRAGYTACLEWVARRARADAASDVLDLGSGTGNLGALLPSWRRLVCVDLSENMTALAKEKLQRPGVEWVKADLLEFFDVPRGRFDAVVSTYTVHHLTGDEKAALFELVRGVLKPGGRAVFGDLMFEDANAREEILQRYADDPSVAGAIEEEFFWDLSAALPCLRALGAEVEVRRFSELSWGVAARWPASTPSHRSPA